MTRAFLDTNIVIYAMLAGDPKQAMATALLRGRPVLSVQTLNECANVLSRKLKWDWPSILRVLADVKTVSREIVPVDYEVHAAGLAVAQRYRLAIYDAMIVAAALTAGCERLYSEDMHHGLVIEGRLTVENPFLDR